MEPHEFIVGRWYKHKCHGFGKFSKFSLGLKGEPDTYFHFSELINTNLNHEYYNGNWYRADIEGEIDISIIASQLPYAVELEIYQIF